MKRDWDLIRDILFYVERHRTMTPYDLDGADDMAVFNIPKDIHSGL